MPRLARPCRRNAYRRISRPGRQAADEFRVLAPLKEVGLTKSEIRLLSRALNLPTADAPAQPCLSSRIPYGMPVTPAALRMIERDVDRPRLDFALHDLAMRRIKWTCDVEPQVRRACTTLLRQQPHCGKYRRKAATAVKSTYVGDRSSFNALRRAQRK